MPDFLHDIGTAKWWWNLFFSEIMKKVFWAFLAFLPIAYQRWVGTDRIWTALKRAFSNAKVLRTVVRFPKFMRRRWIYRNRFNPIAVQLAVLKSQVYFICIFFYFPIMIYAIAHLPRIQEKAAGYTVLALLTAPLYVFEFLWLSYTSRVSELKTTFKRQRFAASA
jgi:hypothetical protein